VRFGRLGRREYLADQERDDTRLLEVALDELISNRIPLEEINEGYAAIGDGNVARSVVIFD
jgi:Zn-dependent alcohol dehydrogenase